MEHGFHPAFLTSVRQKLDSGDYAGAWKTLAIAGDRYADNAYLVTGRPEEGGDFYGTLVENHWENATGSKDAYNNYFEGVAKQHLSNYLDIMEQGVSGLNG